VRVAVTGAPSGFELRARSPAPVVSSLPLQVLWRQGNRMRATAAAMGRPAGPPATPSGRGRPLVELSSVIGRVVLETVAPGPSPDRPDSAAAAGP
jgi:hypothetical protein